VVEIMGTQESIGEKVHLGYAGDKARQDRYEAKKYCRVCGGRVSRLYKGSGGRRCAVCLHRTHREHLAGNKRVCSSCWEEDMYIPGYSGGGRPGKISLLHLTDIHFSQEDPRQDASLLKKWIIKEDMDYVLISGDLTSRAGKKEYESAAAWIGEVESAGARVAVVPGNHDIGYFGNIMSVGRQFAGRKYHRWIEILDRPIDPCVRGPGCLMLGLNSAHGISPAGFVNGYLSRSQQARAGEILLATPPGHLKVIFCHHPLVKFKNNFHKAMWRSENVRNILSAAGADLFLWGHQHSFATVRLEKEEGRCFAVQSPTLSGRIRDGDYPGFSTIDWHFGLMAIIRSYRLVKGNIEEDGRVQYPL